MARRQNINDNSEPCGFPLRENYLSQICEESDIRVFKILRICSLRMLDEVYSYLETKGYNVFVIHLVRDPRATMSSRLAIKLDEIADNDLGQQTKELCDRYKMNIEYVDNMEAAHHSISPGTSAVTDNRYLRIRYEDLALNTIEQAEYIYRFIGKTLPSEVKKNLKESALTLDKLIEEVKEKVFRMVENKKLEGGFEKYNEIFDKVKDPFETVRDPGKVATKWRKVLTFEQLQTIQEYCKEPMEKFNYKMLHSRSEMLDLDIKNY
uniref:carbohydrate sulfotransferase 5-like n=1 Tax=Styela clava TaxID=7725 RepID=UPI001939DFE1|nr:carbohydrate sulfotransferase 5-like [Styela clava]